MKPRELLRSRLFWKIVGAIALGLLIWIVGPLVAIAEFRPLAGFWVRLLFAPLALVLVLFFWWLERRRDTQRDAALVGGLAASPVRTEAIEMERKLTGALELLRKLQPGRGQTYLYKLPWYVIIGPSGAGKTTALLNSSLKFPAAVEGEYRATRGMPNTPNCEWWFTDSGVLIDTAGRFVTQENRAEDAAGWKNFLKLLVEHRPLQPLNGILIALPEPDLADRALVDRHLVNIRARLEEIGDALGQKLPIYILITKADLLFGFREFFARSSESETEQVLGATAPDPDRTPSEAKRAILDGFAALIESLSTRVADRVQSEPHFASRPPLAAFPQAVAALQTPLRRILDGIVDSTQFDGPRRVRGIYLTSGAQSGDPIDRLLSIAGMPAPGSDHAVGEGRSFFLRRLFSDVIFAEAGLAGENPAAERRRRRIYAGGVAAAAALFVLVVTIWIWGYFKNSALIASTYETTKAYAAIRGNSQEDLIARFDLLGNAVTRLERADDFALGLGQGPRLAGDIRAIYHRDLHQRLAPELARLAERRMQSSRDEADAPALYDDLKSYLILGGRGPRQREQIAQVAAWAQRAWGESSDAGTLTRHVTEMLSADFRPIRIDDAARDSARTALKSAGSSRVYARLRWTASTGDKWLANQHPQSDAALLFAPIGPFSIDDPGIPLFYTRQGYDRQFMPSLRNHGAGILADEKWVMGPAAASSAMPIDTILDDLQREYFDDLTKTWDTYLSAITLQPAPTLQKNAERLSVASGSLSPLRSLMRDMAAATDFSLPRSDSGATAAARMVAPRAANLASAVMRLGGASKARADMVTRYQPLRTYVGAASDASSPLEQLLRQLGEIGKALDGVDAAIKTGTPDRVAAAKEEAVKRITDLQNQLRQIPSPFDRLIGQLADDALKAMNVTAASSFSASVSGSFGARCSQELTSKFPFAPGARDEVALSDFEQYFAHHGVYEQFAQGMQTSIDRSATQWRPAPAASGLGLSQQDVVGFQTADTITRIFFATNPGRAQLSFQLEPIALSGADRATLTIGGRVAQLDGGPGATLATANFEWPGSPGSSITFERAGRSPATRTWPGVWGAFRMMRAASLHGGELAPSAEGRLEVEGAALSFRINMFGVANPFANNMMTRIRCPAAGTGAA